MNATAHRYNRGFTLTELITTSMITASFIALVVLFAGAARGRSAEKVSAWNLTVLAEAHNSYAMDWEGRQFSLIDDRAGEALGSVINFYNLFGCHPAVLLGEDAEERVWGWWLGQYGCTDGAPTNTANFIVNKPFSFDSTYVAMGAHRVINARGFHEYVDGRWYSPVFYAPDSIHAKNARRFFDDDWEFSADPADDLLPLVSFSSYIYSSAAMFDPGVLRAPSQGGWQDPDGGFADAYRSPAMVNAKYPDLKTQMIEREWLRGAPTRFSPYFPASSNPFQQHWLFNHGMDASPLALFFDGSVDNINAGEATIQDAKVRKRTGDGLWSRDTPLGFNGYYGELAADSQVNTSHTILTTDGILGRDLVTR